MSKGFMDEKREWANSGTITAPSNSKIDLGWVTGEQPPHEWENNQQNAQDVLMNKLVRRDGVNGTKPGGKSGAELADKIFNANFGWHNPSEDAHTYTRGTAIQTSTMAWDYENDVPMILFGTLSDISGNIVKVIKGWDYNDDLSNQVYDLAISPSFTIASSPYMHMVSDKDYLYLYCLDNTSGDFKVLKFQLNPWSAVPVDTYNFGTGVTYQFAKMIVCGQLNLAFMRDGSGTNRLTVLDKAFTTDIQGNGNYNSAWTIKYNTGLASDSNRLFFVAENAGLHYLCAANISTLGAPTTPSSAMLMGYVTSTGQILSLGDDIVVWSYFGSRSPVADGLYVYSRSVDFFRPLHIFEDLTRNPGFASLGFDGLNIVPIFSMATDYVHNYATTHALGFIKIPSAEVNKIAADDSIFIRDKAFFPQMTTKTYTSALISPPCNTIFDGNDIWCVHGDSNGTIIRIASIAHR